MTAAQQERFRKAQLKDVAEQQAIYEQIANGCTPAEACSKVVGGDFKLSAIVSQRIEERGAGL